MQCSLVPLHCRSNFLQKKANCSAEMWDYIAPCILFLYCLLHFQQKLTHVIIESSHTTELGTKNHSEWNGKSSNLLTSASLGTNRAVPSGFSLPGGPSAQPVWWLQISIISDSILDQHSYDYERSAWGKLVSWGKKNCAFVCVCSQWRTKSWTNWILLSSGWWTCGHRKEFYTGITNKYGCCYF